MIKSSLARHLIYPLHERLMKRPTFPYLAELERSQWLSRSAMQKLQEEKLAVDDFVVVHVGYAIQKITPQEAQTAWELYDQMLAAD